MAFPSTFQDLQNSVITKARLDPTNDLSKVKDWLNQVYAEVCVDLELNVATTTITLTAGTASYNLKTLASSVVRIKEMYVTPVGGTQSAPLLSVNLDTIIRRRQAGGGSTVANGTVSLYALVGQSQLELYPTPANADVITCWYVALPTALSANSDTPILFEPYASKVLEYGALAEAGDWKGDPATQDWRQMYEVWKGKLRAQTTRRRGTQPGQFKVFPGYMFPPHDPSTDLGFE